jgi:amidase
VSAVTDPGDGLADLDAVAHAALVRAGEVSAREATEAAIARIGATDAALGAVVTPTFDRALERARRLDGREGDRPTFAGVPMLVKDLALEIEGVPLREGSRFLHDYVSTETSEYARRLEAGGFVILGKTATPEFGMAPTCEAVEYGPTRNPWDRARSTSGSSGGSAAAVAARVVPVAHGSDMGGSLRFPASACALFGFKPTRARNPLGPLYGDIVNGAVVEHVLTRSVRDSAAVLDLTSGPAPGDPYTAPRPPRPFADELGRPSGRLRIAYTPRRPDGTLGHPDCVAALDDALALLESLGHELVEADLPGLDAVGGAIGTMFHAATAWAVGYWVRALGREPSADELEPLTRAFYESGRGTSAAEYLLAIGDLQRFSRVVAGFLAEHDVWVTPTMSALPAPLGHISSTPGEPFRALERGGETVAYPAVVANVTGAPAMSVPLWWNAEGIPVGVHVLGSYGDDARLFRLAADLEAARPWAGRLPPVNATAAAISSGVR